MRDVLFGEKARTFIDSLSDRANSKSAKRYKKTFIRYLINSYPHVKEKKSILPNDLPQIKDKLSRGEIVYEIDDFLPEDKRLFIHYVDYLNTLPEDKIVNFSVPDLDLHVKEWDNQLRNQKLEEIQNTEDGIEIIKEYDDGFSWVKVTGANSLEREGNLMKHCVGSYKERVLVTGYSSIYSLRDKNNIPHVTIEITNREDKLEQIRGNSSQIPHQRYVPKIQDFIENKLVPFAKLQEGDLALFGFTYLGRNLHSICELEENTIIYDNLDFRLARNNEFTLPNNLTIKGCLFLSNVPRITELPKGLRVERLYVNDDVPIRAIPEDIVAKEIIFRKTKTLTFIPDNLELEYLDVSYSESLESLPKYLEVTSLKLDHSKIKEIPETIKVKHLNISYTDIIKLPDSIKENLKLVRISPNQEKIVFPKKCQVYID